MAVSIPGAGWLRDASLGELCAPRTTLTVRTQKEEDRLGNCFCPTTHQARKLGVCVGELFTIPTHTHNRVRALLPGAWSPAQKEVLLLG